MALAGTFILAALALRPFPPVERAFDVLFLPARLARELFRPLGWLEAREVRAALDGADAAFGAEREAARALLAAQVEAALPKDAALRAGRAFLVAEVIERSDQDKDLVRVRFPPSAGVEPDMPVVQGEHYVGRVRAVDRRRAGEGVVELVTDERLRVGALADDGRGEPAALVVGGLVDARARRGGKLLLGARHESRPIAGGTITVREVGRGPDAERRAHADGFHLGDLRLLSDRGRTILAVETAFDYAHGLSAVAIMGGPEIAAAGLLVADDAYDEARWTGARVALAGDSTAGRRTRHLDFDARARVEAGAAVAVGARFLGRALEARSGRAIVALLGDPALEFSAVAVVEGSAAPLHLGHIGCAGLDDEGAVLLVWNAAEERGGAASRPAGRARIATSAGDRGVPAGLWVGTCELPAGPGRHVLRLVPAQDPAALLRVRVRLGTGPIADDEP